MKSIDSLIAERDDADHRADYAEAILVDALVELERERTQNRKLRDALAGVIDFTNHARIPWTEVGGTDHPQLMAAWAALPTQEAPDLAGNEQDTNQ